MFVISKNKETMVNMDNISGLYISDEFHDVRARSMDGRTPWTIGVYETTAAAKVALRMLEKNMNQGRDAVLYMPEDEEVKATMINEWTGHQRIDGGKKKNHGGS